MRAKTSYFFLSFCSWFSRLLRWPLPALKIRLGFATPQPASLDRTVTRAASVSSGNNTKT